MFLTDEQVLSAVDAVADCFEWDLCSRSTSAEVQAVASGVLSDQGFPASVQRRSTLLMLIERMSRAEWQVRLMRTQMQMQT